MKLPSRSALVVAVLSLSCSEGSRSHDGGAGFQPDGGTAEAGPGGGMTDGSADGDISHTSTDPRHLVVQAVVFNVVLPLYATFVERSQLLSAALGELCDAPSEQSLALARSRWISARAVWKQAEVVKFGPYNELPLRLGAKIDFWPARPKAVDDLLASPSDLSSPTALADLPATVRGLPVIEYLLFSLPADPQTLVISLSQLAPSRTCVYLRALGGDLVANAAAIHAAWSPSSGNFAGVLTTAGPGNSTYGTINSAVSELANRMTFLVQDIRTDKLGAPLGRTIGGTPQPDLTESRFSGNAINDIIENLAGIEAVAKGHLGANEGMGLLSLLPASSALLQRFDVELGHCRQALHQVTSPLGTAVQNSRASVEAADEALRALEVLLQTEIAPATGTTLTFNDNDGD